MSWLESDIVKAEADECTYLRELSEQLLAVADQTGNQEILVEYYHTLYAFLEKQETIYLRIALLAKEEGDESALRLQNKIIGEMILQGMAPYESVITFLERSKKDIRKDIVDLTGEDLDLPVDLDYNG